MKTYRGEHLSFISYPLGGMGAGMVCLEGTGSVGSVSLRHKPDVRNEPMLYSAITITGKEAVSRVIEAPTPDVKFFGKWKDSGNGLPGKSYGLPRFSRGEFSARFPFATIRLEDDSFPVLAEITGWSPFAPGDEDSSSLPFAALEYTFTNTGGQAADLVYYFAAENFMKLDDHARVRPVPNGFVLEQPAGTDDPAKKGAFCASVDEKAYVDTAWFRGGWFDVPTMLWGGISRGEYAEKRHPDPEKGAGGGATLAVPFRLEPGACRTIRLHMSWFVPDSDVRNGADKECCGEGGCCCDNGNGNYKPWYASAFGSVDEANNAWLERYHGLRQNTQRFTDCFYGSELPEEILEAVSANLCILKSPTVLRQHDGRLWGWEGCGDASGCCAGSCTHVWNYAQAICHLFPRLERSLRETEFCQAQEEASGHQNFRASLPVRSSADHSFHAASDGQLGGVIKAYRDWRISGDTDWLRTLWPKVRQSIDFCIRTWDPAHEGVLKQPHHNTYDIEFWGPDGMCTSFYLGALKAATEICGALGEDGSEYAGLYEKGRAYMEEHLFNGEYFIQKVMWEGLGQNAGFRGISEPFDPGAANSETRALLEREGPKYQYGTGCLSDGVLGVWLAEISGLADIVDEGMIRKSLASIYQYNFRRDLSAHANTQRPGYAANKDAGLLLCTWPHGGKPALPFVYSDEVWTGIEYQAASHLMMKGYVQEGLEIVRGCRARYDGKVRNPFDEYECGHWYARAMASYALLQAYTGVRYDNLTKTLYVSARNAPFTTFLAADTGYGTVECRDGAITVHEVSGRITVKDIVLD